MALGNLLGDGKAQACSLPVFLSSVGAELIKDMGKFLWWYAAAMVCHIDLPALGRDLLLNGDGSSFRGKFHGVVQ